MDFPFYHIPTAPILTPYSPESLGQQIVAGAALRLDTTTSNTWPVANKAYYYPFHLDEWVTIYQLLLFIGATSNGNVDVGVYDSQKNLIVSSGSTAMSATVSTWQELNIADTVLPPGDYLLGVSCSSITGTTMRNSSSDELLLPAWPVYEQTSALPLPDPCVPVLCTDTSIPVVAVGLQLVPTF